MWRREEDSKEEGSRKREGQRERNVCLSLVVAGGRDFRGISPFLIGKRGYASPWGIVYGINVTVAMGFCCSLSPFFMLLFARSFSLWWAWLGALPKTEPTF